MYSWWSSESLSSACFLCESSANYRFSLRKLHIFISFLSISFRFAPFLFANYSKQIDKGRQQQEENDNCSTIFLVPHHSKNFISLRYFFTVESALELSKHLNKELKSGLIAGGRNIHALLDFVIAYVWFVFTSVFTWCWTSVPRKWVFFLFLVFKRKAVNVLLRFATVAGE